MAFLDATKRKNKNSPIAHKQGVDIEVSCAFFLISTSPSTAPKSYKIALCLEFLENRRLLWALFCFDQFDMMSVLSNHPHNLPLQISRSSFKSKVNKVKHLGYLDMGMDIGAFSVQHQQLTSNQGRASHSRMVSVRAVSDDAEFSNSEDGDENMKSRKEEISSGISREDLERIVGTDDSAFSGSDLATLIRKKYGRSYDVQLIKKEFMGRNLLAMNVMWKYVEQRSFPLTEEEYILRLDNVANTLKCWGAVSHIRNSLAKLKERPRIGKAVSIFIDMDESGARSNEWIYK